MRRSKRMGAEKRDYKIILVDDDQGIIDSLSSVLHRQGYVTTCVTDPMEAIERVKEEHFDLMVLDFLMAPIHGDHVVEEIRKFDPNGNVQVVAVTLAHGDREMIFNNAETQVNMAINILRAFPYHIINQEWVGKVI